MYIIFFGKANIYKHTPTNVCANTYTQTDKHTDRLVHTNTHAWATIYVRTGTHSHVYCIHARMGTRTYMHRQIYTQFWSISYNEWNTPNVVGFIYGSGRKHKTLDKLILTGEAHQAQLGPAPIQSPQDIPLHLYSPVEPKTKVRHTSIIYLCLDQRNSSLKIW